MKMKPKATASLLLVGYLVNAMPRNVDGDIAVILPSRDRYRYVNGYFFNTRKDGCDEWAVKCCLESGLAEPPDSDRGLFGFECTY